MSDQVYLTTLRQVPDIPFSMHSCRFSSMISQIIFSQEQHQNSL